ncbi:oxalate/formate MFS antiporter [Mycobacterium sp. E796]|uniref:oxalate/formate MFS antiporter n=1 Tax=Mycobacterium sp. E796 TaxID=1834151 RepID=UPI000A73B7D4|nr:oxalate/formate MFS antiporter [Mycobacterium sp. E796]
MIVHADTMGGTAAPIAPTVAQTRWLQLGLGLVCMMAISSPQYVWTLMTKPLGTKLGIALPELQVTFSILVLLQAFFSPFQGALVDRFGPRRLISIGTLLAGASWVLASYAHTVSMLYLTYGGVGGLGTGIVYVGVVGLMVRWFPDRRGFAAGVVAAGYGMGAILTTFPIASSLAARGVESTLWLFGIVFAAVGFVAAQGLRVPPADLELNVPSAQPSAARRDYRPAEMLKRPLFWLMFFMMTMMATSGLMVTSQMATFATDFGVSKVLVFGLAALPLALTIDRFTNGLTRPFFGWVSDRLGRENTMAFAFALEAVAMTLWLLTRHDATLFVLLSGLVFFGWGEIFSLFPSTLTDTFGARYATANYGWLYISFGIGSVFGGPLAALLHQHAGSWIPVFGCAIALDLGTAALAVFVLKPARRRFVEAAPIAAS